MRKKIDLPANEIAREYKNGASSIVLAKKYNCTPVTIRNRLREMKVEIRGREVLTRKDIVQRRREFHEYLNEDPARKDRFVDLIVECIYSWKEKIKGCENNG